MRNTCSYCQRHFKRAEHLTRHLRTHTKERPFVCECGAAFSRRDLLTRHWRLSKHSNEEVSSPSKVAGVQTVDIPVNDALPPVEDGFAAQTPFLDMPTGSVIDGHQDDGLEVFLEFLNFMDGVGLPTHWSPNFGHEPDASGSIQDSSNALEANNIGTPFSTWLPSAPPDNEASNAIPLRDSLDPEICGRTYVVTEAERSCLLLAVESFRPSVLDFKLPSRHALTRYLISFFEGFHSHLLFIHEPTFKISNTPLELTLAMCSAGAQYCFERRLAQQLFHAAHNIVCERLRREEKRLGPHIRSFMRMDQSLPREGVPAASGHKDPWVPLDSIKTLLILVGYATWEVTDLLQKCFALRQLLVHCIRDIGLVEDGIPPTTPNTGGLTWEQWIEQESARRTKLITFCYVNVHSIAYDVRPMLWCSELHLRLPCSTDRWQARSAAQWASFDRPDDQDQMFFQEALSLLLYNTDEATSIHPNPSPLGNYILLHALLQRIHIVRELSLHASYGAAAMPSPELQIIGHGLRCWTSMWQQAPESGLDPNNKSGPVPFTSSALLGIAYVRLSLNIGPFRQLDLRDPDSIAMALTRLPDIERNDSFFSALLYSTHALSIPVRLGIDRVARSQAFFWSVQHALSAFECAVFLMKWLSSLPTPSQNATVHFEDRVVLWIKRIVEEAYAVVDFDEPDLNVPSDPFSLGLVVLTIWSRFFQGNTQWPFVVILGKGVHRYGEYLRETRRQSEHQALLQ